MSTSGTQTKVEFDSSPISLDHLMLSRRRQLSHAATDQHNAATDQHNADDVSSANRSPAGLHKSCPNSARILSDTCYNRGLDVGLISSSESDNEAADSSHLEPDQANLETSENVCAHDCHQIRAVPGPDRISSGEPSNVFIGSSNCKPTASTTREDDDVSSDDIEFEGSHKRSRHNNESRDHRSVRKSKQPMRSPQKVDPKFCGVTLQIRNNFQQDAAQLAISSRFSYNGDKQARRVHASGDSSVKCAGKWATTDYGAAVTCTQQSYKVRQLSGQGGKQCASCGTKKTPLWRDAEDRTPLCNACGIRYKKYRVRCVRCWRIPKKESKSYPRCANCGQILNYKFSLFRGRIW